MSRVTTVPLDSPRADSRLAEIVASIAATPDDWIDRVRFRTDRRWYERLHAGPDYDVWLITWLPGQGTGFHDHGASSGAFAVASGVLEEERAEGAATLVHVGDARAFDASVAHDVRNPSMAPAISIHAYSPPLSAMTHYERDGDELVPIADPRDSGDDGLVDRGGEPPDHATARGIARMLAAARTRLHRLSASEASTAVEAGALLVDIRPSAQRSAEGEIPGALVIERNVLEWRFDPASDARLAVATGYDLPVIVFCSEGYTSSLAAAALQDIGLWRATDVIGGFHAWRAAGLAVTAPGA